MALHHTSPQGAAGRTSSPSLLQREEAATTRERALAGEVERIASQRAALLEQSLAFDEQRRGAPMHVDPVIIPDLALEPVLSAIRLVREEAVRERGEASEMLEQRLDAMRRGLAQAQEQLAASQAEMSRARAEAQRAAKEALIPRPRHAPAKVPSDELTLGETLARAMPQVTAQEAAQEAAQRRTARRVDLVASVDFHSDTNFFNGFSSDISAGGLFVTTVEHAPVGTKIDLKFTLPGGLEIEAEGEVRWVRELSDVQPELLAGVGVAFTNIAPESVQAIESFVFEREPMFFPDA
jgi:uncharacterized protein (TIGR02266 family)